MLKALNRGALWLTFVCFKWCVVPKDTKGLVNWGDRYPLIRRGAEENVPTTVISPKPKWKSLCQVSWKMVLRKNLSEVGGYQCDFRPGRIAIPNKVSLYSKFRDTLGVWQRCLHIFCRFRESIWPGPLRKSLSECRRNSALMCACY